MSKRIRFTPPLLLFTIIIIASIAATPAQLAAPGQPTAVATANAGELQVSWNPVPGAQHYTVGYANPDEMDRMAAAGRNKLDAFTYVTVGAANITHTFTGLEPGTVYWVTVGAHTPRFRATDLVWASQHAVATTAGEHGDGFCPITGLPIPEGGYLGVGDTFNWTDASFKLDSATTPSSVPTAGGGDYTAPTGRKLLKLCGTRTNNIGSDWYFRTGTHNNLSTDLGIGFARVLGWDNNPLPSGSSASGCDTWTIPEGATTAVYAIDARGEPTLYQIDLTSIPTVAPTPMPTPRPTATPQPTVTPQPVSQTTTGYGDWFSSQHDCPSGWSRCTHDSDQEAIRLWAHTHNSALVPEGATVILPHRMAFECAPTVSGQNRAWADFAAWGYDIYDASPSITVTADGGTSRTYAGHQLWSGSNAGLYFSISDTERLYRQIANATEVVITSTVEAEGTTARAEFTVTGIVNAVNTLSCWSLSSAPAASPGGAESIRTDTPSEMEMDALNAGRSVVSR